MRLTNQVDQPSATSYFPPQSFILLKEYFHHSGWRYEFDDERQVVNTHVNADSGLFRVVAVISPENDLLEVAAYFPCKVLPESRSLAAEFCLRASYGLTIGHLEMDFDDGTVRLHVSTVFADEDLNRDIIHRSIGAAVILADRYNPHLLSAVYGNLCPADAVENAEKPGSEEYVNIWNSGFCFMKTFKIHWEDYLRGKQLFSPEITNDPWMLYHGTSSFYETEVDGISTFVNF